MITQGILDYFRDIIQSWIAGIGVLVDPSSAQDAAAAISGVGGQIGALLWLFLDATVYLVAVGLFGVYIGVLVVTQLVAMVGRRMAPGK